MYEAQFLLKCSGSEILLSVLYVAVKVKHGCRSYHYKPKYHEQLRRAKLHDITNIEEANLGVGPAPESTGTNVFQQYYYVKILPSKIGMFTGKQTMHVELSLFHNSPPKPTIVKINLVLLLKKICTGQSKCMENLSLPHSQ